MLIKSKTEEKRDSIQWNTKNEQHVPKIVLEIQTPALSDPNHHSMLNHPSTVVEEKPMESVVVVNEVSEIEQIPKETSLIHNSILREDIEDFDGVSDSNCCQLWGNNWRQFTSVLPGMNAFPIIF